MPSATAGSASVGTGAVLTPPPRVSRTSGIRIGACTWTTFSTGRPQLAASQVAQASAIISGLAPKERWSPLVDLDDGSEAARRPVLGGQRDRWL